MPTHYALQVLRAERSSSETSTYASQTRNLYVRVTLGKGQQKTDLQDLKDGPPPIWNETLVLSSDNVLMKETLLVELKQRISLRRSRCLGSIDASLADLMGKSALGEVPLSLHSAEGVGSSAALDVLYVRLRPIDAEEKVSVQIESAVRGVEKSCIGDAPTAVPFHAIDKGIALEGSQSSLAKLLGGVLSRMDVFVALIDKLSSVHPYLSAAWRVVSSLYKAAQNQQGIDERFVYLVQMMEDIFKLICAADFIREKVKTLEGTISQFMQQSAECCLFIHHYLSHGFIRRALDPTSDQKIQDFTARFRDLRASLDSGMALCTSFVSSRMAEQVDIIYLRNELDPPVMNASSRKQCLPGTRTEVMEEIMDWLFTDTDENILWLRGVAGSGKSTISMTVSEFCQEMCRRGAYLFFEREKSNPYSIIQALAVSLATFDQSIAKHVSDAVRKHSGIAGNCLALQFTKLVCEPLRDAADSIQGPVMIILDGLDECGTSETREAFLSLVETEFSKLPRSFRFLITSRPEKDISQKLTSCSARVRTIDLDISSESSREDVSFYIQSEMRKVLDKVDPDLTPDWDQSMTLLCNAADGLFVWASTAVKMVSASDDPFDALETLVSDCRQNDAGPHQEVKFGLNSLYESVLQNSGIRWDNDRSRSRFTRVLSLILLGKVPLSISAIDGILGFPKRSSSRLIIERLQSVLVYTQGSPDAPIRIFHASFSDYLTAPGRAKDPWYIDVAAHRHFIATQCFKVMQEGLRFNICNIGSSYLRNGDVPGIEERIKEKIPPALEYACCFWAAHLCDVPAADDSHELLDSLVTFAQQSILHWMEVLSLKRHFWGVCSHALIDAISWSAGAANSVSSLLRDAHQFATTFAIAISESVPHIYLSALSFQEETSMMRKRYSAGHPGVHIRTHGSRLPQSHVKIFEGHADVVSSVAFSPDGKRVASGSDDKTIRVWDVESGTLVAGLFEGHADNVTSVAFSTDGRRIVSGSYDKTIRVWDAGSGALIAGPFEGHTDCVRSVAFSADGRRIVSGSWDKTIRVWDADSGTLVAGPFEGHTDYVMSVAFSPDGRRVASGSRDRTIRLWDADSGAPVVGPFKGHTRHVRSVAFSADGKRIVSGSRDKTIRVWDADNGALVAGPFGGHTDYVNSVAFSADGRRIVSGSCDKTVRVWEADNGALVAGPFEGHTHYVTAAAFSADGKHIVSGSWDKTIRLWDTDNSALVTGPFEGHADCVMSVAFSADGRSIVSGSYDRTIRVWAADSGALIAGPFEGHAQEVSSVAFSAEGRRVVSGSYDKTIRVWDVDSGAVIAGPFEGHTHYVSSVAFSTDGKRIVSGSWDKTIRVWDSDSGTLVAGPFEGHTDYVMSVAFSADGKRIVSGSRDKTIRVWDADSGALIARPFEGHTHYVTSVAFSADGKRIASGSLDRTVRVWNADSGALVAGPFEGHTHYVTSVAFSADGKRIVSGSGDKTIRVWEADGGAIVTGPFEGHAQEVSSVAFSADGRCVVSGSHDRTIRVWKEDELTIVRPLCETSIRCDSARSCSDSMRDLLAGLGINASWMTSHDGWLLGRNGELLLWVPPDVRPTLWQPSNVAIFSCRFFTVLDFTSCRVGPGWHEGFPRV